MRTNQGTPIRLYAAQAVLERALALRAECFVTTMPDSIVDNCLLSVGVLLQALTALDTELNYVSVSSAKRKLFVVMNTITDVTTVFEEARKHFARPHAVTANIVMLEQQARYWRDACIAKLEKAVAA